MRIKWAAEGDIPRKFYFNRLKQQRHRTSIPLLLDKDGRETKSEQELQEMIQQHFEVFLKGEEEHLIGRDDGANLPRFHGGSGGSNAKPWISLSRLQS